MPPANAPTHCTHQGVFYEVPTPGHTGRSYKKKKNKGQLDGHLLLRFINSLFSKIMHIYTRPQPLCAPANRKM